MERDEEMKLLGEMSSKLDFLVVKERDRDVQQEKMEQRISLMEKKIIFLAFASLASGTSPVWLSSIIKTFVG